jgi:transcriptional antiterminator NusG
MIVTDESWFIVRNTPMVTGFLGSSGGGAKPVPLQPEEIIPVLKSCGITIEANVKFKVGDEVQILNGNFTGQVGTVESIDAETQIVTVLVDFFGRQTPTELSFEEVKPPEYKAEGLKYFSSLKICALANAKLDGLVVAALSK